MAGEWAWEVQGAFGAVGPKRPEVRGPTNHESPGSERRWDVRQRTWWIVQVLMTDAVSHLGQENGEGGKVVAGVARGGGPRPSGRFRVTGGMGLGGPGPVRRGGTEAA